MNNHCHESRLDFDHRFGDYPLPASPKLIRRPPSASIWDLDLLPWLRRTSTPQAVRYVVGGLLALQTEHGPWTWKWGGPARSDPSKADRAAPRRSSLRESAGARRGVVGSLLAMNGLHRLSLALPHHLEEGVSADRKRGVGPVRALKA
jgi:hypothetical protein